MLQSMGSQRVGHDLVTEEQQKLETFSSILHPPERREGLEAEVMIRHAPMMQPPEKPVAYLKYRVCC